MGVLLGLETTRAHPIVQLRGTALEAFLMKRGIASIALDATAQNLPTTLAADVLVSNDSRKKARLLHFLNGSEYWKDLIHRHSVPIH